MNKWVWLLVGVIFIFAVGVTLPVVKRQRIEANQTSAVSRLRCVGFALSEFESEYGKWPDAATALEIKRKTGSSLTLSDRTSNDVFVQLLATGIVASEMVFATYSQSTRKPDGDWHSDATALAPGETGFAYISGLSSKDNPSIPIVFGPVFLATRTVDAKSFENRGVALKLDNSVTSVPITPVGKIIINGHDFLDPGNAFWQGKPPDVKWPK